MTMTYKAWKRAHGAVIHKRVENSEYFGNYIQIIPNFEYDDFNVFGIYHMNGMFLRSEFSDDEEEMLHEADTLLGEIYQTYN